MRSYTFIFWLALATISHFTTFGQTSTISSDGWAGNSINTVIFRKNSLVTWRNTQYVAFYDSSQYLVLGKRQIGNKHWELRRSQYRADANDAHKSISIMADGNGILHVSWGHHNDHLNYVHTLNIGSLDLTDRLPMTAVNESRVSYPEFFHMPNGDLLFLYRNGESGNGNLVINRYLSKDRRWIRVQDNLIDGEGQRNAYWQATIDPNGGIHISWTWRESPNVSSNHDICYARSLDGGKTWQNSSGSAYSLPIVMKTAEYVCRIPQESELINQTAMTTDHSGKPYIATYWRTKNGVAPQYHLIFRSSSQWVTRNLKFRKQDFSLSGVGTKKIPISRPQLITWKKGSHQVVAIIFRDAERRDRISIATSKDINMKKWTIQDLSKDNVGAWEPSYDSELWRQKKVLDLFVQPTWQPDNEGIPIKIATPVSVLEWRPLSR